MKISKNSIGKILNYIIRLMTSSNWDYSEVTI